MAQIGFLETEWVHYRSPMMGQEEVEFNIFLRTMEEWRETRENQKLYTKDITLEQHDRSSIGGTELREG